MLAAAANTLHLSPATLEGRLTAGESLRAVASSQGVPFGTVQSAVSAALQPVLRAAVQQQALTSSQETAILQAVSSAKFGTQPGLPRA